MNTKPCHSAGAAVAFKPADILLPARGTDYSKWSVIACDQYTSQPEYWERAEKAVGGAPSTLRLVLPEAYLDSPGLEKRIDSINLAQKEYLDSGLFEEYKDSMVYVRRIQSDGSLREGLVGAIDLEEYDYLPGSQSQVRATEATVAERIPPRLKIRQGACLELPHIMILIDDPQKSVIEPLGGAELEKLYDFNLMLGGGSISGYLVPQAELSRVNGALSRLLERCPMLFAMGDGNHSLATAKEYYNRLKAENPGADLSRHPARYALCEIVNLHSPALRFEAIHRIVFTDCPERLVLALKRELGLSCEPSELSLELLTGGTEKRLYIHKPTAKLAVGCLQAFLDGFLKENGGRIDYIHGEEVVKELSARPGAVGFILEPMEKSQLFPAVMADGALPRKTFSMGHADDKRFYLEARRIAEVIKL